jgi:glycosidase
MSDPKTETPNQQGPKRTPMNGNQQRTLIAKLLALHQATLRGTLFIYQGQEIGMANLGPGVGIEEYKDGSAQRFWEA